MRMTKRDCLLSILVGIAAVCLATHALSSVADSPAASNPEIGRVTDRYAMLNWTVPSSLDHNSFMISVEDCSTGDVHVWSLITFNDAVEEEENQFTLVNYTKDSMVHFAPKLYSSNFTYFVAPLDVDTLQVKVTGLSSLCMYRIKLDLAEIDFVGVDDRPSLSVVRQESWWVSPQFTTMAETLNQAEDARGATLLTIGVIVLVFIALFAVIARMDIPFNRVSYVFIMPAILALAILEVYPLLYGIMLSFTAYGLHRGEKPEFVGFDNYAEIGSNPQLSIALTTTLLWVTLVVFFKIVFGFIVAYLIKFKVKRKKLWYLLLYLPWAIPAYIKILSWRMFFQGSSGDSVFNHLFGSNVNLIDQPYSAFFIACFVEILQSLPLIATLFLGALNSVPRELTDLAEIGQIPERARIRRVILPLVRPMLLPAIILEIIKAFGSFNVAFLLTRGYPMLPYGVSSSGVIGATDLFSTFTFYMFYQRREIGIAAAYSVIMGLLTLSSVLVWVKMSRGTRSMYRPDKQSEGESGLRAYCVVAALQSLAYIVSAFFGFRYFGLHWSKPLTIILAVCYMAAAFSFLAGPYWCKESLRIVIIADLILSLVQFAAYQMWFAFNWNLFIAGTLLYLLSGVRVEAPETAGISNVALRRVKSVSHGIRRRFRALVRSIDCKLAEPHILHLYLLLECLTLILIGVVQQLGAGLWVIGLVVMLLFIASLCHTNVFGVALCMQPLIIAGLYLCNVAYGWIGILVFLAAMFTVNWVSNWLQRDPGRVNRKALDGSASVTSHWNSMAFLAMINIMAFIPFVSVVLIAFAPEGQLSLSDPIPKNPTLDNFSQLFAHEEIHHHFWNSLIVSLGCAFMSVVLTVLAAHAFSRYEFKAKSQIMVGVFVLRMFTGILTLIPLYLIIYHLGLIDNLLGVIITYSTHTIPLGLWIIKGYMDSIPKELDESAYLMGNSPLRVIRKILLPLSGPALAVAFLFSFLSAWNGFLLAFVLLQSPSKYTLPVKLYSFVGSLEHSTPEWGFFAAASILVCLPLLVVFAFLKDHILGEVEAQTAR